MLNDIKALWGRLVSIEAGRWWASYLCLLSVAPALIGSLILPSWLCPLAVGLSGCAAYFAFKSVQPELFKFCSKTSYLYLNLPLYTLCLVWAAIMVLMERFEQVPRTVGPVFLLIIVCVWPIYRFKTSRTERRVPFKNVYPVFAAVIAIQQIAIIWKEFT